MDLKNMKQKLRIQKEHPKQAKLAIKMLNKIYQYI